MATRQQRRNTPMPGFPEPTGEWRGLAKVYERMTMEQLNEELARINGQLESRSRSTVSEMLASRISDLDRPVARSPRTAAPSPSPDRGQRETSPSSPTAHELLTTSGRIGPRLAAKLVRVSAQARRHR